MRANRQSRKGARRILARVLGALAFAGVAGALILVLAGDGRGTSPVREDCIQRVKVWSPSRQAHVTLVQAFCG